jgi:glycine cleavage system H protein
MENKNKRYTKTHEWAVADGEQLTIGITQHAQALLGDLVYVELPKIGRQVKPGDELGVVESVKAAADFYAPVSGQVVSVNPAVQDQAALVNQSPELDGWLVKLAPSQPQEWEGLLSEAEYLQHINESH